MKDMASNRLKLNPVKYVVCDTLATAPAQQGPRDIRWI